MGFFSTIERTKTNPPQGNQGGRPQGNESPQASVAESRPADPGEVIGADTETERPDKSPSIDSLPDPPPGRAAPYTRLSTIRPMGENPGNFKAAWPWLQENLDSLLSAGWSRASLFQRGKLRYPAGQWGIAWLDAWRREGLTVSIGNNGKVVYQFEMSNKMITQTAQKKT